MDKMRIGTLAMQVNLWASLGYGLLLLLVPDVATDVGVDVDLGQR